MPSEGERLHGFTVVSGALRLARQLVLPAIVGGASAGSNVATTVQWIAVILVVPSIGLAFARWLAFRYRLEGDEIIIDSGVLSRSRRVIPIVRMQNIDLRQSALERLARVAELRLETASGSGETEASLAVLDLPRARALQAELTRRRAEARAGAGAGVDAADTMDAEDTTGGTERPARTAPPEPRLLLHLSTAQLALAGATANEAGLLAAGLATALEFGSDLAGPALEEWIESAATSGAALGIAGTLAVVLGLLGVVLAGWVLSVVVTIIRYHDFTLTRVADDIRREYGLLSRHQSTVPLERVQAVRIEETLLRRAFGLVALKVETAGASAQQRQGGDESEAFVPIARKQEVGGLLREVFPDARFGDAMLNRVSHLARRRTFFRLAGPLLIATAAAVLLDGGRWLWLLALLVPAWLYAGSDYRARAWGRPDGYTLVRRGVFTRVTWVVPERKVQTLHLRETPFQRRLELATLMVDTAAGGRVARVDDLEESTALSLLAGLARDAEAARRAVTRAPPATR